jgi:hypothetical protein
MQQNATVAKIANCEARATIIMRRATGYVTASARLLQAFKFRQQG